jgi:MIP family channel proteins
MDGLWKALLVEFLGTFTLVFVGTGAAAITVQQGGSVVGTALAFGLILVALYYAMSSYSGSHFNPAVTFGFAVAGRMGWGRMILYWIAQILGAIAGAAFIAYFYGGFTDSAAGVGFLTTTDQLRCVLLEATMTFFFVLVWLLVTRNALYSLVAGLVIGLTLTAVILGALPATGASFNPARSLGTLMFHGNYSNIWIYIVGPLLGALVAGFIYRLIVACWNKPVKCPNITGEPKICPPVGDKDCGNNVDCSKGICAPMESPNMNDCKKPKLPQQTAKRAVPLANLYDEAFSSAVVYASAYEIGSQ